MKKTMKLLAVLAILFTVGISKAQIFTKMNTPRNTTVTPVVPIWNFMYIDTSGPNASTNNDKYRALFAPLSLMTLQKSNISGLQTDLNDRPTNSVITTSLSSYLLNTYVPTWISITGKPSFFTGDYNDLTNKPTLFSGAYNDLTGKPSLFSGSYLDLTNKPTLFSGAYTDLTGKPSLAAVATSGDYNDLINKPTIPTTEMYYNAGSLVTNPKKYTNTVNTNASGIATFTITNTGISSGSAIFTNVYFSKAEISDNTANYNYLYTLSGDKKTMTITVTKVTAAILGILQFNSAPANTPVQLLINGN